MIREVKQGAQVLDHFPVFKEDGYTKKSGLTSSDFSTTVFQGEVVVTPTISISEIGATGEYKVSCTFGGIGEYEIQVLSLYNYDIWHGRYESVDELTNDLSGEARDQALKIDQSSIDIPPEPGSLFDLVANKDSSQTYARDTDSLEALSGAQAANSVSLHADMARVLGLLHKNSILDNQAYDSSNHLTYSRLRVFDSAANVPAVPGGNEINGKLHEYELTAEYSGADQVKKFSLKQLL